MNMKNFLPSNSISSRKSLNNMLLSKPVRLTGTRIAVLGIIFALYLTMALPMPFTGRGSILPHSLSPVAPVSANAVYYDFTGGNLNFNLTAASAGMITTNDDWSGVTSAEGYFGRNLTATHGIDPQTVLGTEFASNQLPNTANTNVSANKQNPSAFNAGGIAEFDAGPYLAIGFQGNVQANPYMVFYLNSTGHSSIRFGYTLTDIDEGSNNAISPVALQYRVGETGNFTNIPAGFVADVTDGPTLAGRQTTKVVTLPAACNNQAQLQIRLITTNAANSSGGSTPDEWIGVNNITVSVLAPTAASATAGGRVFSPSGRPLANATVIMYDSTGNIRSARSNTFGFYSFSGVPVGENYVFEVRSKKYVFSQATQVVYLTEDNNSIDFYADPLINNIYRSALNRKSEY